MNDWVKVKLCLKAAECANSGSEENVNKYKQYKIQQLDIMSNLDTNMYIISGSPGSPGSSGTLVITPGTPSYQALSLIFNTMTREADIMNHLYIMQLLIVIFIFLK